MQAAKRQKKYWEVVSIISPKRPFGLCSIKDAKCLPSRWTATAILKGVPTGELPKASNSEATQSCFIHISATPLALCSSKLSASGSMCCLIHKDMLKRSKKTDRQPSGRAINFASPIVYTYTYMLHVHIHVHANITFTHYTYMLHATRTRRRKRTLPGY